jgi:hypothetical protein
VCVLARSPMQSMPLVPVHGGEGLVCVCIGAQRNAIHFPCPRGWCHRQQTVVTVTRHRYQTPIPRWPGPDDLPGRPQRLRPAREGTGGSAARCPPGDGEGAIPGCTAWCGRSPAAWERAPEGVSLSTQIPTQPGSCFPSSRKGCSFVQPHVPHGVEGSATKAGNKFRSFSGSLGRMCAAHT